MQRRREQRYQVWESVVLTVLEGSQDYRRPATVVDISRSGYRLLSGLNLDVGTPVLITLNAVAIFGSVRHCERQDEESFTTGVEITQVLSEQETRRKQDDALAISSSC